MTAYMQSEGSEASSYTYSLHACLLYVRPPCELNCGSRQNQRQAHVPNMSMQRVCHSLQFLFCISEMLCLALGI